MKLSTTTPASHSFKARLLLGVIAFIMAIATPAQIMIGGGEALAVESSSQLAAKVRAIEEDLAGLEQEMNSLRGRATSLKQAMNQFAAEKAVMQAKINLNQAEYNSLTAQIKETEEKIETNRDVMGDIIADMYIADQISPIEMIFSSKNISEFLDAQEYRNSIRDELKANNEEIKVLKAELETKRNSVAKILSDQKTQRDVLATKEAEQRQLLADTQGKEAMFASAAKKQSASLKAAQVAHQAAVARELAAVGSGGTAQTNYPWKNTGDTVCASVWDKWGYCYRQCTSYVAWKLSLDPRNSNFSYLGHAYSWWNAGKKVGANEVDSGDVIVRSSGKYGHVMYVEYVSGDTIHYTDYNGIGGVVSPGQGTISKYTATSSPYKVIRFR